MPGLSVTRTVKQIYYSEEPRCTLNKTHVKKALETIGRLYPPVDATETFALLAALNLLNAAIKTVWGRSLLAYNYIKGGAGLLFEYLSLSPVKGVQIYHDRQDHVTYFRVMGVQMSFHYAPISHHLPSGRPVQQWDGIRLQLIAVELFSLACSLLPDVSKLPVRAGLPLAVSPDGHPRKTGKQGPGDQRLPQNRVDSTVPIDYAKSRWWSHKFVENKRRSLDMALHFSIWRCNRFTLLRRKDMQLVPVMRYDGQNYQQLVSTLIRSRCPIPRRRPGELFGGFLYYISPKMRLRAVHPSHYLRLLAQNSYLCGNGGCKFYNLLVTYGIARYLTMRFPQVRFACTLITNRHTVRNRLFNNAMLRRIPLYSRMRRLKVWLLFDPMGVLCRFRTEQLPKVLREEYLKAEDYYQEFEITCHRGCKGIYAYRRHHLLKPVYRDIEIYHYHAYVQRSDGKWAIYSLNRECFESNFIYSRIWYDRELYIIFGEVDGRPTIIHEFFNPNSRDYF